jgi:hypothetical protein
MLRRLAGSLLAVGRGVWRAAARALRITPAFFAGVTVLFVAARAIHFSSASFPSWLDDGIGEVMALGFSFAVNQGAALMTLISPFAVAVAVTLLVWLVARIRGRSGPRLLPLPGWVITWTWLGLALGNTLLDSQPGLFRLLACTAPVLLWAARSRTAPLGLAALAVFGAITVWLALGQTPDLFDFAYAAAWATFCLLAIAVRPRLAWRDWGTGVVVAFAVLQASALVFDRLPLFAPDRDAEVIAEGNVFHWCENTERGLLYATHTSCNVWTLSGCHDDFIAVHDLKHPQHMERLRFFDDKFFGRMLHLLCLPDRVQVGMAATFIDGRLRPGNVMEFSVDDPTRVTRDVLGAESNDGIGAIFLWDRANGAVFYVSESQNQVLRVDLATGARRSIELPSIRRWPPPYRAGLFLLALPGPTSTGPDATYAPRGTGFFVEWMRGSKVVELDLTRAEEVGTYRTNNGGNQAVAVDEGRARLLVTGVWGLEVFDLVSGRRIARVRTPFGPRLPVIDAAHDLVFVPTTFGNHILVLDRDTFRIVGRLAVGTRGRFGHLTADGSRLFASGGGRTYVWDTATLAHRFGHAADRLDSLRPPTITAR